MDDPSENKNSIIEIDTKSELDQVKQSIMHKDEINTDYENDDITMKKEDYQIVLCQDGKFAATFDTATHQIKILRNTDHRPFLFNKKKNFRNENESRGSVKIDKTIAYFNINEDFTINFCNTKYNDGNSSVSDEKTTKNDKFKWAFDISNMYKNNDKHFILVAISRINIDEDMKGNIEQKKDENGKSDYEREQLSKKIFKCPPPPNENENIMDISPVFRSDNTTDESKKGIAIYHIELTKNQKEENEIDEKENEEENGIYALSTVTCYYSNKISGICKFIEVSSEEDSSEDDSSEYDSHNSELRRLIILNFRGIYNIEFGNHFYFFELNEKFEYPQNIRRELNNRYTFAEFVDCMNRLLSCIYDKYFLVTKYINSTQTLEVYDLAKMEHEIDAMLVGNIVNEYNHYFFVVSGLLLCFTQVNTIKLFYMENGLQVASKKFDEIKIIYLLEFFDNDEKLFIIGECPEERIKIIIWDLFDTGKHELIELDDFPITKVNVDDIYTHLAITSGNILQIDNNGNVSSVLKKVDKEIGKKKLDKVAGSNINLKKVSGKGPNGKEDKNHTIYYDENINFKQIVIDGEPWVPGGYERNSYCLYYNEKGTETETLQLIVGRSTVQIWHQINDDSKNKDELPNKGEAFLEYIWSNRIPVKLEGEKTRLIIEEFEYKYGTNDGSNSKINDFYLKVYWYDDEINTEKREKVIKRKDIEKFHVVRHACKALGHIRKRCKSKNDVDNYKYEKMINYIEHMVWRFAKHEPENFKLLDVRYNLMKSLILGDCDRLIKFILFGYEETAKSKIDYRHVPSNKLWPGKKFLKNDDLDFGKREDELKMPENNMELVIYYCRGRNPKDAIIVAYLLEYYSRNPTNCVGWMCTVSKAVPLLFKYNYDDFARKLFIRCFADQGFVDQDPDKMIPKEYLESHNNDTEFRALIPIVKLKSDKSDKPKWYDNWIWNKFKCFKNNFEKYRNFEKSSLALRLVPFPDFTMNSIKKQQKKHNFFDNNINHFLSILIPRQHQIKRNEWNKLSPFSRMVLYNTNDDIYDNPAIEAVVNFHWQKTKYFLYFLCLRFLIFAICFVLIIWAYLNRGFIANGNFLLVLIIVFYYLATYLILNEVKQFLYHGFNKYFINLFNIFDISSIILSVSVMSIILNDFQLSDGFEKVEISDASLVTKISFSVFFLWIELILYLRLIPVIGIYIYHVVIVFKTIFPFFLFILIVIFAFAHTMFILLRDPKYIKFTESTYSGVATNSSTNETLNIDLKSDFDPKSSDDNPFSTFYTAMEAAYFWISGNWAEKDNFINWAVDVFTFIGSIFLVIVIQNVMIAYISNVYEGVVAKSRQISLKFQANFIADYEALHLIHFSKSEPESKHIYYFSQVNNFEKWYNTRSDNDKGPIYKNFEIKSLFTINSIFKEKDYDKYSLLTYDDNIKMMIEDLINIGNDAIVDFEYLIERFKDKNLIEEIGDIKDKKIDLKAKVEKLHYKLEELKK